MDDFDSGAFLNNGRIACFTFRVFTPPKYIPNSAAFTLPDPVQGNQLLCAEIDEESVKVGAVLGRDADTRWELRRNFAAGDGATFDFHPVFGHDEFLGRQIKDLAGVVAKDRLSTQRAAATARAPG